MLKWIIYSLILVNVGVFVWNFHNGIPLQDDRVVDDKDDHVQLVLLNEKQVRPESSEATTSTTTACYSVGPFTSKFEAGAAKKKLHAWGVQGNRRTVKTSIEGYWVIIPAQKTRQQANKQIKKLKELGIKDFFLVTTGSRKNAISLGVFSRSSSARRRLKQMQQKGIKAKVAPVDLPKREYWLDWPTAGTSLGAEQLTILQKTFKDVGKVARQCRLKSD